jgi:hypothetical protein
MAGICKMLTLQEITVLRTMLDRVGDKDRPIVGKQEAYNLVGCFQALDREEQAARAVVARPAAKVKK